MGPTPCCSKVGINRGTWTPEEDGMLAKYIKKHGEGGWRTLPKKAGLLRCGKSCRLRWMNYLRPDVKRGQILADEEDLILRLHRLLGNRWSLIAGRIPGRTDNEIKNFWNTHLSKKLISRGIDPRTHRPLSESELENHHNSDQNSLSPAYHFQDKYPQTAIVADNVQAFNDTTNGASKSMPLQPVLKEYSSARNQHSCNTVHMNPTLIPYCKSISEVGLRDHDASLYLRRNSTTNANFVAPSMTDSILQSIASFPGTVNEKSPYEGLPLNFEQSEMQQRHVPEEIGMDLNAVTPGAIAEDNNSDIFVYFLESFMDQDELHDEINKDAASSPSENRHQLSHAETPNQHG